MRVASSLAFLPLTWRSASFARMNIVRFVSALWLVTLLASAALAAPVSTRWTGEDDADASFGHVVEKVRARTGAPIDVTQFLPMELRDLATSRFEFHVQLADGLPIYGMSIRIWKDLSTGRAIQVEAQVDDGTDERKLPASARTRALRSQLDGALLKLARLEIRAQSDRTDDSLAGQAEFTDQWVGQHAARVFQIRGRRGVHHVQIALAAPHATIAYRYAPFATSDAHPGDEFSVRARVYPIYEETYTGHQLQPRIDTELKYLNSSVRATASDPFGELRERRYLEEMYHPLLGETAEGREQGYWASSYIKREGMRIRATLPLVANSFESGAILDGRYATVSIHPNVPKVITGLDFTPAVSSQLRQEWFESAEGWEMIPMGSLLGRPLRSADDAFLRPAVRLPDHNPAAYLNSGFDEVQVYYAVTAFMESLQKNGLTDPDLSTRPFNAFLYDPDISMRDNAYYTEDTINFTTYSPDQQNMARDNPTIWHELGHGIMDRLMGEQIRLADTGGLSEGMADFLAELVVRDLTETLAYPGQGDMRISNQIGFGLTNEVHDDGEAYGGAMKDMLDLAIAREGMLGVKKVTDLTLESMRLTRNHPALTAQDWFSHMLFADRLGSAVRRPGELDALLRAALAGRNFRFDDAPAARFTVMNGDTDVTGDALGTRENPIRLTPRPDEVTAYALKISLTSTESYQFRYPVTVRVELKRGPLQGAIDWVDEATNPRDYVIAAPGQELTVPLAAKGVCETVNRPDGSCVDFAYLQVLNDGYERPVAKKRFYLRIKTQE